MVCKEIVFARLTGLLPRRRLMDNLGLCLLGQRHTDRRDFGLPTPQAGKELDISKTLGTPCPQKQESSQRRLRERLGPGWGGRGLLAKRRRFEHRRLLSRGPLDWQQSRWRLVTLRWSPLRCCEGAFGVLRRHRWCVEKTLLVFREGGAGDFAATGKGKAPSLSTVMAAE